MQTSLTRTALAVLVISLLFLGCKKSTESKYYVKFKVNGNWVTMKNVLGEIGPDLSNPNLFNFGISANSDDQKDLFDISLQTDADHFETQKVYNSEDWFMPVNYSKNISSSNSLNYDNYSQKDGMDFPHFTLTFTLINDKEVKGSFTGNYLYDTFNDELVTVAEGEFYARRIR